MYIILIFTEHCELCFHNLGHHFHNLGHHFHDFALTDFIHIVFRSIWNQYKINIQAMNNITSYGGPDYLTVSQTSLFISKYEELKYYVTSYGGPVFLTVSLTFLLISKYE